MINLTSADFKIDKDKLRDKIIQSSANFVLWFF
jgi:hypothetical protein